MSCRCLSSSVGFDQREFAVINRLVRLGKGVSGLKKLISVGELNSPSFLHFITFTALSITRAL